MSEAKATATTTEVEKSDLITLTIDGVEVSVPKDMLVIRAAEQIGIQIPRFCDHPLLAPAGACRQCLVEVPDAGNGRGFPKPQTSCTLPVAEGMVVHTQATSAVADKAQHGIMEFLLINHPLDCPMCDKGGECPLQNQAMSNGREETRYTHPKRSFVKPVSISPEILLDRERCISCLRCVRFADEIAGDPFITMVERGPFQYIDTAPDAEFLSYFSGNTIQICPVGALTSADYRFRSRPFDLVSSVSIAEHDACGAQIRVDHRRGKVMRRQAGDDPTVNEEWITDKDRFAFTYARTADRLAAPMVRDAATGALRTASWPEAFAIAARGLDAAVGRTGLLPGGRLTIEDAYAWSKFARVVAGTNDIDFRARRHSAEEEEFLAGSVVLGSPQNGAVTYHDLEHASVVLLAGLEPEDEAGTIFLRLRKANLATGLRVAAVAPFTTRGLRKLRGRLLPTAPGEEAATLRALAADAGRGSELGLDADAVILAGERLVETPGALTAAAELAAATGARLAWVPRRAGDRGAVEAGCLPSLLPGGRPVTSAEARVDLAAAWGVATLPEQPGRDADAIMAALVTGDLDALVVGGVDERDVRLDDERRAALARAFVVSLELRHTPYTELADVVLPVAPVVDKAGTFVNWEGRMRPFARVLDDPMALPDVRVLAGISEEAGRAIGIRTPQQAAAEFEQVGAWEGERNVSGAGGDLAPLDAGQGAFVLASWKQLVDDGCMQDGEKHLRATARPNVVLAAPSVLADLGVDRGDPVVIRGPLGSAQVAIEPVRDMVAGVVWAPATAPAGALRELVGPPGCRVDLAAVTEGTGS